MKETEHDRDFQRFCGDLESLRGTVPLEQPEAGFSQRVLRQLPADMYPHRSFIHQIREWFVPSIVAGGAAAAAFFIVIPSQAPQNIRRHAFPEPVQRVLADAQIRGLPVTLLEQRAWETQAQAMRDDNAAIRLWTFEKSLRQAREWLSAAGVPPQKQSTGALQTLAELMTQGFGVSEWGAVTSAIRHPRTSDEAADGAKLVALWNKQHLDAAWWRPVLKDAARHGRIQDVLAMCERADNEHMPPRRLMIVIENRLPGGASADQVLAEMRHLNAAAQTASIHPRTEYRAELPASGAN